jgi:hypothetical protein
MVDDAGHSTVCCEIFDAATHPESQTDASAPDGS